MGCNPDILENICPSGLRPSGLYFPIYPDYNPCIISIFFFQLGLLDFGATREYRKEFVDEYFNLLDAAARNDKETMLSSSVNLGKDL